MNIAKKIIFYSILAFCLILAGCSKDKKKGYQMPPTGVTVATAKTQQWQQQIHAIGTLLANQGILVKSEIAGRITKIYFKPGQAVKAGTPLVQINPDILRAEVNYAKAQLKLSSSQYKRYKKLYSEKAVSKEIFDEKSSDYKSDEAQLAKAEAELAQTTIKAPFSGKLGIDLIDLGDYVQAGTPIVQLQDLSSLRVNFTVPGKMLGKLKIGQSVEVQTASYPNETFTGKVYAFDSTIDPNTRNLSIRVRIPNPKQKLLPGAFVNVTLFVGKKQNVVTVPQTAIVYNVSGDYVYTVVDNKAIKTDVDLGERYQDEVAIKKGLKADDVVVTAGQIKLKNEAPVVIVENKKQENNKK